MKPVKFGGWVRNISYSFIGKVIAMVALVILDVVAARTLELDAYAEWAYFFSILTMLFYLGWFGLNSSAKIHISRCTSEKEASECLHAAFSLRLFCSFGVSILVGVIMPQVASKLGYPMKYPELKWLLGFAAVLVFLNSFTEFYKSFFTGRNEFKKVFVITVVEYSGYLLFSVIGFLLFHNVKSLAFGYCLGGIVVGILGIFFLKKSFPGFVSNFRQPFAKFLSPIFRYALPIMIISIGGLILVEMDTFMLGLFSTEENVATYNIAKNLCSKATHVNVAITDGVMISFAVLEAKEAERQKKSFRKAMRVNTLAVLFVSAGFLIFSGLAIRIMYGQTYAQASTLLRCLIPYYAMYAISNFFSQFLDFRGKATFRSICYLSIAFINLILNYLWIPKYGAFGAAIATDISILPYTVAVVVASWYEWKRITNKNRDIDGGYQYDEFSD